LEAIYRNELKQTKCRLGVVESFIIQNQNAKCVSVSHKKKSTLKNTSVIRKGDPIMKKPQNTHKNGSKQLTNWLNKLKSKSFIWLTAISLVFGSGDEFSPSA
jgi:hypothetical protein